MTDTPHPIQTSPTNTQCPPSCLDWSRDLSIPQLQSLLQVHATPHPSDNLVVRWCEGHLSFDFQCRDLRILRIKAAWGHQSSLDWVVDWAALVMNDDPIITAACLSIRDYASLFM